MPMQRLSSLLRSPSTRQDGLVQSTDVLSRVIWGSQTELKVVLVSLALSLSVGVPLNDPTPLYAWSLIWLSQDRHPMLRTLLRRFAETGLRRRWLEYDAARDWLPAHDQAELRRLEKPRA